MAAIILLMSINTEFENEKKLHAQSVSRQLFSQDILDSLLVDMVIELETKILIHNSISTELLNQLLNDFSIRWSSIFVKKIILILEQLDINNISLYQISREVSQKCILLIQEKINKQSNTKEQIEITLSHLSRFLAKRLEKDLKY